MKSIELKKVELIQYGNVTELDYKTLLQALMESPIDPAKGAGIGEIRRSCRVLDALEKCETVLEIEDADFDYMLDRVRNAKYTTNNKAFIDFVDYFEQFK